MVEQEEKPTAEEVAAVITGSTHIPSPAHTKVESGIISVCSYKRRLCSAAVRELCSAAEQDNHDNAGVQEKCEHDWGETRGSVSQVP